MPVYKRGQTWWIDYTDNNGKRIRESARTKIKKEAEIVLAKIETQLWQQQQLGIIEKPRYTWQAVVVRWLNESSHKSSIREDKRHLKWMHTYLGDKYLDEINKALIDKIKAEKLKTGVSNGTVNRMLAILKAILNRAKADWEWLDNVPTIKALSNPNQRVRWITQNEALKLLNELPPHLETIVRFALETGLRESNIVNLQWSQVDLIRKTAWIHAENSKSGKAIAVPLTNESYRIIKSQLGINERYVCTYKGQPVTRANNHAWRKALSRAGIKDFRFHDLRHTWASWHVQKGTPLNVLKELGGWSDLSMVMRYAHLSSEHLANYAQNGGLGNVTNSAQCEIINLSKAG